MFSQVHKNIQNWYAQNGRHHLPWRQTDDPYKIYISEIMLQQTQVATVLDRFYTPFIEQFPTLESLASASLDEVLKAWEGLGYYRRAKNLHHAAQSVAPRMPQSVEGLIAMKGVGQSTAHAVAAFAYKAPVPILDANVKRILYRLFAKEKASDKELWQMAYDFFDAQHPYEFNQALMDIGSMICTKKPQCASCPIEPACLASDMDPLAFPAKKSKKAVPVKELAMMIYSDGERLGLMQREGEFLHGLWGFVQKAPSSAQGEKLGSVVHKYSHFHLYADVYKSFERPDGLTWFTPKELEKIALSTADHKALKLL